MLTFFSPLSPALSLSHFVCILIWEICILRFDHSEVGINIYLRFVIIYLWYWCPFIIYHRVFQKKSNSSRAEFLDGGRTVQKNAGGITRILIVGTTDFYELLLEKHSTEHGCHGSNGFSRIQNPYPLAIYAHPNLARHQLREGASQKIRCLSLNQFE